MTHPVCRWRMARAWAGALALAAMVPAHAWEPPKPVEFVVPAGTGGGADQMARLIQGVVVKHKLMKEALVVVNKSGGAGAEGFLSVKDAKGDPHKIIISLSNLFTTPMATGVPFNWKDMTPVAMMALDQFVLWVNADAPYKTAGEYVAAVKQAGLVDTLSGAGPFTVFAPTNDAFGKVPKATVDGLMKPTGKDALTKVLTYHVVPGKMTAADLAAKIKAGGGKATLTTVQGEPLTLTLEGSSIKIAGMGGSMATVETADVMQSNGVVHVVNGVLTPSM